MTPLSKPLWLLDVDGVCNAIDPKPKHVAAWGEYSKAVVTMNGKSIYQISFSSTLMTAISELIEDGLVEVQWLTTWQDDANGQLREALGLPRLKVASTREEYLDSGAMWWKLRTAKRVAMDRPLIWTDDDLQNDEASRWVTERPWPTLAIAPSYRGGIQPKELEAIYAFLSAHAERASTEP